MRLVHIIKSNNGQSFQPKIIKLFCPPFFLQQLSKKIWKIPKMEILMSLLTLWAVMMKMMKTTKMRMNFRLQGFYIRFRQCPSVIILHLVPIINTSQIVFQKFQKSIAIIPESPSVLIVSYSPKKDLYLNHEIFIELIVPAYLGPAG